VLVDDLDCLPGDAPEELGTRRIDRHQLLNLFGRETVGQGRFPRDERQPRPGVKHDGRRSI